MTVIKQFHLLSRDYFHIHESTFEPVDGCVADAGDRGEDTSPIDLLLCLLTVCRTFDNELWEIDLSRSDITLYGRND